MVAGLMHDREFLLEEPDGVNGFSEHCIRGTEIA